MRKRRYCMGLMLLAGTAAALSAGRIEAGEKAYGPAAAIEETVSQKTEAASGEDQGESRLSQTSYLEYLPPSFDVNTLRGVEETSHLILAVGDGKDKSSLTLWYYGRGEDGRLSEVFGTRGTCGQAGITENKVEGDKKTPSGLYSFLMAFGLKADPGSKISYRQVQDGDCFVDDVESRYYNQYVNSRQTGADWRSAEVLKNQGPCYNYSLVLSYNTDHVPGKGSAIFLHCPKVKNDTYTAGCIGIPEEHMETILTTADAGAKILIVEDKEHLSEYQ